MKRALKLSSATLAAATALACAPLASASEAPAPAPAEQAELTVTTFAAGVIGDTFECGGAIGKLWCKK
ncbi:hypothetical protein [Corynebacterium bouchesdurhonense]|uniref:hypothetical protein n=1 Tax=Corynebacterium bouchesdurhonense TaxID=1720192 RepID=UPI000830FE4F|nr:hypothetical protein [Corynebacterium bouchesdurhonense]